MNVTIVNPTSPSFLTVFPADADAPLASNLNWVAGQSPTPNAVTSDVSVDGKVSFFNNAGSVDVIADIVGYFVDHNHDDRYYTKPEVDTKLAALAPGTLVVGPAAFGPTANTVVSYLIDPTGSINSLSGALCFQAPVSLPNGATVTALTLDGFDASVATSLSLVMNADPIGSTSATAMASAVSGGVVGPFSSVDNTIASAVVDNTTTAYSVRMCSDAGLFFYSARVNYTTP